MGYFSDLDDLSTSEIRAKVAYLIQQRDDLVAAGKCPYCQWHPDTGREHTCKHSKNPAEFHAPREQTDIGEYEINYIRTSPAGLRVLAAYHHVQATEASGMDFGDCSDYHLAKARELEARADEIEASY